MLYYPNSSQSSILHTPRKHQKTVGCIDMDTVYNTVISSNFLVFKFCGKAQFHKISTKLPWLEMG